MKWISLLLLLNPIEPPINYGVVEVNTVCNEDGTERFKQVIFRASDGEILAWRWAENLAVPKGYRIDWTWQEGQYEQKRFIRFIGRRIDTKTDIDPEVEAREWLPELARRGLR